MRIKLSDIFIPVPDKLCYTKQELLVLEINNGFIDEIAKQLDLTYLKNDDREGNLCFVNNKQLRPAFKMFFSKPDVIDYLNFVLKADDFDIKIDEVPFPGIAEFFMNQ